MSPFRLSLLGGFVLHDAAGREVRLPTRKAEALLAYLALESRQPHARESLAALLWGHSSGNAALASLRQTLSLIGKACGREALLTTGRTVALAPGAFDVDVDGLAATADVASHWSGPALNDPGELLAGLAIAEPGFADWLQGARQRVREQTLRALVRQAAQLQAAGRLDDAVATGLQLLAIDPLLEPGHRLLMELYAGQGRRSAALRQYQVCVNALQRELGAEPEAATRQLYNALLRQLPGPAATFAAPPGVSPRVKAPAPIADDGSVHEAPLVGREDELSHLLAAWTVSQAGQGSVVALLGEAGMGKSRLADELAVRLPQRSTQLLLGRCHESQQLFPLAPWAELLRAADVVADDELLARMDPAWRAELAWLLPELAPTTGRDTSGQSSADGSDDAPALAQQARLFEAVVQVLALLVARSPRVLTLEDLHWADDLSPRLLALVARRAAEWPLLLVVTAREEELAASPALRSMLRELDKSCRLQRLSLQPLSRSHTADLVQALRPAGRDARREQALLDRVWQTSEGNPFVVVEATHALEALPDRPGNRPDAPGSALPERVRDLIAAQLDRLGPAARQLVPVLAVAGRELDFELLQHAADVDALQASEALEELVRRRVLRLVGDAFDFKHARIRQVAADAVLPHRGRQLHLALAQALERKHAAELPRVSDWLAYHFARTDEHDKAVTYLDLLACRSAHEGAHEAALASLGEALHHATRSRAPERATRRLQLVLRKARSLFFLGRFDELLKLMLPEQTAVLAVGDARLAAAFFLRLASTSTYLGQHDAAVAQAERALQEATAAADTSAMGKAHFQLALENFWARPELGVEHGEQAVALLEGTDQRWSLGQACWILGLNLSYRGRFVDGLTYQQRARALAQATGDRRLASYAAWTTGFIHSLAGDLDDAVQACRESVELALDPLNRMTSLGMLALALVERRDSAEACTVLDEAIAKAVQFRIPQMEALFLAFRGEAALQQGDMAGARSWAAEGARITAEAGYRYGLGWAQRVQARVALAAGEFDAADAWLAQSIATFDEMGAPFEVARTQVERAQLLASRRSWPLALSLVDQGVKGLAPLQAQRQRARAVQVRDELMARAGSTPP